MTNFLLCIQNGITGDISDDVLKEFALHSIIITKVFSGSIGALPGFNWIDFTGLAIVLDNR
jgi:hypothetical protein